MLALIEEEEKDNASSRGHKGPGASSKSSRTGAKKGKGSSSKIKATSTHKDASKTIITDGILITAAEETAECLDIIAPRDLGADSAAATRKDDITEPAQSTAEVAVKVSHSGAQRTRSSSMHTIVEFQVYILNWNICSALVAALQHWDQPFAVRLCVLLI